MANSECFRIVTFNPNGLGDSDKRTDVFDRLREMKANIYFLQETHWKTEIEDFIRAAWGYNIWISGKESNKNGVAILFNNNFEYVVHSVERDPNGCFVALDIEMLKKRLSLINVYGPSSGDDPSFFTGNKKLYR